METAVLAVKQDRVPKYWTANKDNIEVRAEFVVKGLFLKDYYFLATYDLAKAELKSETRVTYLEIPFLIQDEETGETQDGTLEWDVADWQVADDSLYADDLSANAPSASALSFGDEPPAGNNAEAGILLGFDDDYHEAWERNFGLFDKYGARVTFFVQGKPLAFCKKALECGHDIGYHTIHHLNLSKATKAEFAEETTADLAAFRRVGVPLASFAYPFGLSEPWMNDVLLRSFKVLRGYGVTFRIYKNDAVKGYIISKAIDNTLYKNDGEFRAIVTLMLRTVKFTGGVLSLTTHDISDTAAWGIKPARLEYLLKTAQELGLRFYVYRDF
jgi:peptidoglycan/xylan/chitin deacetylase (PgdA/CDA1 family)